MAALITLGDIKDFLTIPDNNEDNRLRSLANYVSAAIESYCGREFASAVVTNEIHDGGRTSVFAARIPVNNVASVEEYDGIQYVPLIGPNAETGLRPNVGANADAVINYLWYPDTGEISRHVIEGSGNPPLDIQTPARFKNFARGVKITYNGGYDTIPDDLKMAALDFVKLVWKNEQATSSFSLQGESKRNFSLSSNSFPPHIKRILDLYRLVI